MEETNHQYTAHPVLSLSILPKDATVFFDNWPHARKLPTPEEIRTRAFDAQYKVLNERPTSQRIFYLPDLGLVIKHGERTTIAEGQVPWAITEFCPRMRAPTVYEWRTDGGEVFMYLSYVDGVKLDSRLETLNDEELKDIAGQLAVMLNSLRRVTQPAQEVFIGTPDRGPVNDQMWWNGTYRRTFTSVKEYNQALFKFARNVPQFPQQEVFQNTLPRKYHHLIHRNGDKGASSIGKKVDGTRNTGNRWLSPARWDKFSDVVLRPCEREFEAINTYASMGLMI